MNREKKTRRQRKAAENQIVRRGYGRQYARSSVRYQSTGKLSRRDCEGVPWPSGPWDNEPDEKDWTTKAGLPGRILRSMVTGALCGYVGVPKGHPLHGYAYGESLPLDLLYGLKEKLESREFEMRAGTTSDKTMPLAMMIDLLSGQRPEVTPSSVFEVHGGITWADSLWEKDGTWWYGFDCAHAFDLSPAMLGLYDRIGLLSQKLVGFEATYRDLAYVEEQVESLARQIADLAPTKRKK